MKKYSIKEVDLLRSIVATEFEPLMFSRMEHRPIDFLEEESRSAIHNGKIEDRVRTYMTAGVDPEELAQERDYYNSW